jgi:hypothetical protein
MARRMKGKGKDWICDVCGQSSSPRDWAFVAGSELTKVDVNPMSLLAVCPECGGALIFELTGHVHWNPKTGERAKKLA